MFRTFSKQRCVFLIQKRYRHKKKWASNNKQKSPTQLALDYFDLFYKPVYKEKWPSIRLALLSQQKYGALVNNFNSDEDVIIDLIGNGASDIIQQAQKTEPSEGNLDKPKKRKRKIAKKDFEGSEEKFKEEDAVEISGHSDALKHNSDLYNFMPATRIVTEKEELLEQELDQAMYRPSDAEFIKVIDAPTLEISSKLKCYTFDKGEIALFPRPKVDSARKLGYYLMDAASVLPVMALNVQDGDTVLDLCAAPGGKSLAILQAAEPENLYCVDESYNRLKRLKEVMRWYTPKSYMDEKIVQPIHGNGIQFCNQTYKNINFDKVLVDVPCYTDRHVVMEEENNLFRPIRVKERLEIQNIQKHLLCGGIKSCKPGGHIVYSTCSLSMPQNDGTVQAALEEIWQTTKIDVVVEDTNQIKDKFREIFHFYDNCRFGQLVLPHLTANFGPTYFCKLRRLN